MIDATSNGRLLVSPNNGGRPHIRVAYAQLPDLKRVLEAHRVWYDVRDSIVSFDGGPEVAYVHLARYADAAAVQAVLDAA